MTIKIWNVFCSICESSCVCGGTVGVNTVYMVMVGSCTFRIITVLQEQSDTFGQLSNWSRYPIWLWFFIVGKQGTTCHELHVMSTMDGCLVSNPTISEVELLCGQNWHTKTDHCWSHWRQVSNYLTDWPCISTPKHLHTQIARQPRTTSRWYIATSVNCGYVVLFYTCLNDKLFWKKYTLVSQNRFGITTVLIFKHSFANLTIAPSYSYSLLSADIFQKLSHFQDPLAWKGYNSKQRTLPIKCQN